MQQPGICLVVMIGSRTRPADHPHAADAHSDWDFQVATSHPERFSDMAWLQELGLEPVTYVKRGGRLGSAQKVTAAFPEGDADWVILPDRTFRDLLPTTLRALDSTSGALPHLVVDLATVLQGGYRIVKGADEFGAFFHQVATRVPAARLSDESVCNLADGFVCDYISTLRKIDRGELLAARRWLHHTLLETNFRLIHELRLREGRPSLPDGRRLERLGDPRVAPLSAVAAPHAASLRAACGAAAGVCRDLMRHLVGERWRWPDLRPLGLRTE